MRPAKTASVQQNNSQYWSEWPAICSVFWKFPLPKNCSKHVSKFKTVEWPPKVSSLVDRMSTNVLSVISKTESISDPQRLPHSHTIHPRVRDTAVLHKAINIFSAANKNSQHYKYNTDQRIGSEKAMTTGKLTHRGLLMPKHVTDLGHRWSSSGLVPGSTSHYLN